MDIAKKFKETVTSVLPVVVIVFILHATVAPLGLPVLLSFFVGCALLILGLTLFLLGVDIGIIPLGEHFGVALTNRRNVVLLLGVAFLIGFIVTAAEPAVRVLTAQVNLIDSSVSRAVLLVVIAAGVGLFMAIGLARIILAIPLKWLFVCGYLCVFALVVFTPRLFTGIAFDAGGATTGAVTVPFIMSFGIGVSSAGRRKAAEDGDATDNSFGLTGVASIGPISAVLLYGIVRSSARLAATPVAAALSSGAGLLRFASLLPGVLYDSLSSIGPLFVLFVIAQLLLLKMPPVQVRRIVIGFIYAYIGLVLFMLGVNGGFMEAGDLIGRQLGSAAAHGGGWWVVLLIAVGCVLGAVVVCAEPSVWVLTDQVELISGGTIRRWLMVLFLAGGSGLSIGLSMVRAVYGFNVLYMLIPGYVLALALSFFCPPLFTGIAFDSGGVASGMITTTFILSFTLGAAAEGPGGATDPFGAVALVAMVPLIAIQVLGLLYSSSRKKQEHA
ncbi:MAG: DUF1538 domain-containing protein [Treponema sp.]|nr:DUF1538 domain-containing protein [Treponema sp.]